MESKYDERRSKIKIRYALMNFNVNNIRKDFPIFGNNKLIYFDNASTTQKPKVVIEEIKDYYSNYTANVHRGVYSIAEKATLMYEESRKIIAKFLNADTDEIIFTKGTTESINFVSNSFAKNKLKKNDEVIITEMEHHSNIIPWQILSKEKGIIIKFIPILKNGHLDLEKLQDLITSKTKLISITQMSNVLGVINPVSEIIKIAKKNNIEIFIDAAQSISHLKIDVKELNCDYLAFSGHKILGPTGVGVLYIKKNKHSKILPLLYGGHMIKEVSMENFNYNDVPWKFEAGTANIAQVIGMGKAIEYFQKYNKKSLHAYTSKLYKHLVEKLFTIENIKIYPTNSDNNGPVVSFSIKGIHDYDLTKLLDTYGICIRSGHHCAQPILNKYNIKSLSRISLYFYNTIEEVDYFYDKLKEVIKILI